MDEEPTPPAPRPRALLDAWREHRFYGAAVGYLVAAWVVLQVAAIVLPGFGAPAWALRALMVVLALGLGVTLLAVWSRDRRRRGLPLVPRAVGGKLAWALTAVLPAAFVTTFFLLRPMPRPAAEARLAAVNKEPATPSVPEKSIAVLPFENLSDDKANGFFTDGVQDEILTDLARVADLRVVSRTSVMQYRGNTARDLRGIAAQLGVAHIVEGSVQRAGNEVRVNAQLIDARTDAHEWAMNYDKTLDNVFTVQTEVAQAIAEQLRARISPEEHVAMTTVPTRDALALQLYQQAKELDTREADTDSREGLLLAVSLLEQAVKRDPGFLSAYCLLSRIHLDLYWNGFDHTDGRREAARAALADAARVGPDAGETHLAQAVFAYHGFRDYDRALAELAVARRSLPNSAEVSATLAFIYRRQGRWEECVRELEQAAVQDPRNFQTLQEAAFTHAGLRRYAEATRYYRRALAVSPSDTHTREEFALVPYLERGDLGPLQTLNASLVAVGKPAELESSAAFRLLTALAGRDPAEARSALAVFPATGDQDNANVFLPKEWFAGMSAAVFGDAAAARANFAAARDGLEAQVRAQPEHAEAWSALGRIDAMLGRKDEALREGRRASELLPISRDAWDGPAIASNLAAIYARTGEKDLALQELERLTQLRRGNDYQEVAYGPLKLDPRWEPLRGDPRFDAIVASLAPRP
ncbi:MAG: hypothetical protein INR65_02120 [Gluconacetobacter diazotrophicus]|nr:hypothetical protein [Gluconacetobacter diazotrophicus]